MKEKKTEYHVGELAKYFGVSNDTIRLYDNMGIISAKKNYENNYRVYSREDLICLDYVFRLRRMNFSLEEIRILLNESSIEHAEAVMQMQEKVLEDKIQELQNLKMMVKDYQKSFSKVIQSEGQISVKESPVLIYKEVERSMIDTMEAFAELAQNRVTRFTFVCDKDVFLSECFEEQIGNSPGRKNLFRYAITLVDNENFRKQPEFPAHQLQVLPPRKCVHSIAKIYTHDDYTGFTNVRRYILQHGLELEGDALFCGVSFKNDSRRTVDYYEIWIPVK